MSMNKHQGFLILELAIALLFTSISFCLLTVSMISFINTFTTASHLLDVLNRSDVITHSIALNGINGKRDGLAYVQVPYSFPIRSCVRCPSSYRLIQASVPWKDSMNQDHSFQLIYGYRDERI